MTHLKKALIFHFIFFAYSCSSQGIGEVSECGINPLNEGGIKTRRTGEGEDIDDPNMYLFQVIAPIDLNNSKLDRIELIVREKNKKPLIDTRLRLYIKDGHASNAFSVDNIFLDGDVCVRAVYNSLQDSNKEIIFSGIVTKENTTIFDEHWE